MVRATVLRSDHQCPYSYLLFIWSLSNTSTLNGTSYMQTLHPAVHGGILAVRGNAEHEAAMAEQNIVPIDLVVLNLYVES